MHQTEKKILGVLAEVAGCKIQFPGTYGMHQTKKKILVYQQGLQGAKFVSLGQMECIRLGKKNSTHLIRTPRSATNVVPHA